MRRIHLYIIAIAIILQAGCKPSFDEEISIVELKSTIEFLASDSLKGRYPGTAEDRVLSEFIAGEMSKAGLDLYFDNGLQEFSISKGFKPGASNMLVFNSDTLFANKEINYIVPGFSATGIVTAKVCLIENIDDNSLPDLTGKLLILPFPSDLPSFENDAYRYMRDLSLSVADKGAAGIIYLLDEQSKNRSLTHNQRLSLDIPVIFLSTKSAQKFLGEDPGFLMKGLKNSGKYVLPANIEVELHTEILPELEYTYNTAAELEGSKDVLKSQYVIIGAHHDHLGMGGRGTSSRMPDTIAVHYGADDNASGVCGVIEIAEYLTGKLPSRSFLFTTFGAEEKGILGSKYLAENPPIDLSKVQAMINLDMIGRLKDSRILQIGGVGTSPGFTALIDTINKNYGFDIKYSEAGYGPSDHSAFYAKDIPVLFISTGAHTDYHTPLDAVSAINYEGMKEVISFTSDIALALANMDEKIEFTMAGPKESSGSRGRQGKITFGLMPDFTYDGTDGMPVSFVTEGKPAAIGGMKDGDIIKTVDGKTVGNVYDYMNRLDGLKEGQTVVVKVERDGSSLELLLQL